MRSHQAVIIGDAAGDARLADERWAAIGVTPRSFACAPVELGGRYLGLIELVNPLDGHAFTDGDGHALTYIGQQFADFVAQRGVVVDAEHVLAAPASKKGPAR
jgi:GAF domain-containing protein